MEESVWFLFYCFHYFLRSTYGINTRYPPVGAVGRMRNSCASACLSVRCARWRRRDARWVRRPSIRVYVLGLPDLELISTRRLGLSQPLSAFDRSTLTNHIESSHAHSAHDASSPLTHSLRALRCIHLLQTTPSTLVICAPLTISINQYVLKFLHV